jgi:hypothetical protein
MSSCFENSSDDEDENGVCKDYSKESAEEVCKHIKQRTQELKGNPVFMENLKKFISDSTTPSVKTKSLKYLNSTLKLEIPMNKITTTVDGECDTLATTLQFNSISNDGKEKCDKIINDYIYTLPEGSKGKTDLKNFMENTGIIFQNVTQENVSKTTQSCVKNTLTTLLQKSKLTIDKIALDDISKELKGIEVPDCSKQKTQVSSCNYLKAKKCCESRIGVNQINVIDPRCSMTGTFKNILQKNDSTIYTTCITDKEDSSILAKEDSSILTKEDSSILPEKSIEKSTDYKYNFTVTVYALWGVNLLILCLLLLVKEDNKSIVILVNLMVSLLILSGIFLLTQVQKPPSVYSRTDFSLCGGGVISEEDKLTYDESLAVMYEKEYKGFVFKDSGMVTFFKKDFDKNDCGEGDKYKNIENVKSVIAPLMVIPSNYKIHMSVAGFLTVVCIVVLILLKLK